MGESKGPNSEVVGSKQNEGHTISYDEKNIFKEAPEASRIRTRDNGVHNSVKARVMNKLPT